MLYDPVDAFFQGLSSSIVRIPMTFIPLLAALTCFILPYTELEVWSLAAFPLVMLGVIVAWAAKGLAFFIGLIALLTYLVVSWQFVQTDYPKEIFLALFATAFVFFIPLSWGNEEPAWKSYIFAAGICAIYILVGYGLPLLLEYLDKRKKA